MLVEATEQGNLWRVRAQVKEALGQVGMKFDEFVL